MQRPLTTALTLRSLSTQQSTRNFVIVKTIDRLILWGKFVAKFSLGISGNNESHLLMVVQKMGHLGSILGPL